MQPLPSPGSDGAAAHDGGAAATPEVLTIGSAPIEPTAPEGISADPAAAMCATDSATLAATIVQWRAQGWARLDPVRFRFIEALARRAEASSGATRRVLHARLLQALESYRAKGLARMNRAAPPADLRPRAAEASGSLGELLSTLAADKPAAGELKAVGHFRSTWTRLGVEQRLRQSRAKVPGNAGPLNSHALVLRSLTLMHELSPEYLTRFIGHVDALLWLEQANGGQSVLKNDVLGAEPDKPAKKGAARRRQAAAPRAD